MVKRSNPTLGNHVKLLPPLPIEAAHWQAIVTHLGLSPKQANITELLLRSAPRKQIAEALDISEPTLKTHLSRIFARTGTSGPMQLAMRILAVSHQVQTGSKASSK